MFKVPCPITDRVKDVARRAKNDLAKHTITQTLDAGLYRAWKCGEPGNCINAFEVVTGPGWLLIRGDMGTCLWERTNDMLGWCRGSINSLDYFAEKVPREIKIKEYDPDRARAWLLEQVLDFWNDHCGSDDHGGMDEDDWKQWETLKDLYRESDPTEKLDFEREVMNSGINDGGDYPDWENYTYHFLWQREALKWLFANLDKVKNANRVTKTIEHYRSMSSLFMDGDVRGPMMAQAAKDFEEAMGVAHASS